MKKLPVLILVLVAALWIGDGSGLGAAEVQVEESGCRCLKWVIACDTMGGVTQCWYQCDTWVCDAE